MSYGNKGIQNFYKNGKNRSTMSPWDTSNDWNGGGQQFNGGNNYNNGPNNMNMMRNNFNGGDFNRRSGGNNFNRMDGSGGPQMGNRNNLVNRRRVGKFLNNGNKATIKTIRKPYNVNRPKGPVAKNTTNVKAPVKKANGNANGAKPVPKPANGTAAKVAQNPKPSQVTAIKANDITNDKILTKGAFDCHLCEEPFTEYSSLEAHLKTKSHQIIKANVEEKYLIKANLMRSQGKTEELMRNINVDRLSDIVKTAKKLQSCNMCNFSFYGQLGAHCDSANHVQLKNFLHPRCSVCNENFKTPIDFDNHVLSSNHVTKVTEKAKEETKEEEEKKDETKEEKKEDVPMENEVASEEKKEEETTEETGKVQEVNVNDQFFKSISSDANVFNKVYENVRNLYDHLQMIKLTKQFAK